MSENKILIPAILSRYSPRSDKSWSVTLNLNEPNPEQKVIIDRMHQQAVYVLIKDAGIIKEEENLLDALEAHEFKVKTQSQILRNVLYLIWEKKAKDKMTDKEFYRATMQKVIDHFKNQLD